LKRVISCAVLLLLLTVNIFSEVIFSDLDLSSQNILLFQAKTDSPVFGKYKTLFSAGLTGKKKIKQLTFFPERALYLQDKGVLQIQNRFGVFRSDTDFKNLKKVNLFPSFAGGSQVANGKINPIEGSPDGRYLLYNRQISDAFGDLIIYDLRKAVKTVVSDHVEYSLDGPEAIWSPDSKFIIYHKGEELYYYSIDQLNGKRVMAEKFRRIGKGRISNVKWGRNNSLFYVSGDLVYMIDSRALFTRALYSGFLKIGSIKGKIPFKFDSNFDEFWISPSGDRILLNKWGRNIFLYLLSNKDYLSIGSTQSLPYLYLPRSTYVKRIVWNTDNIITVLTMGREKGKVESTIFRLKIPKSGDISSFRRMDDAGVTDIVLSSDGREIVLLKDSGIYLKSYSDWKDIVSFAQAKPLYALWADTEHLIVSGAYFTRLYNLADKSSGLIALSQPGYSGFNEETGKPMVRLKNISYEYDSPTVQWVKTGKTKFKQPSVSSGNYRAYLEESSQGSYKNMVMIRDTKGYGTKPLFPYEKIQYEKFPDRNEPVNFNDFTHGSRIRRREVSLVFNAIDSIEGLAEILRVLGDYSIRATFFVNGEFIRRYPDAVKEIAESGHEVGSLFYVYFNMTDSRFHLDKEFIKSGLAKNEDDYFNATGKDLSLIWHAPYYFVSSEIIAAAKEMNYTYIGRDIETLDWVSKNESNIASGIYFPSSELVERILKEKKPGSIIPVRVGIGQGGRDDYLFQKIDLLIDGLVKRGYSIVPVSQLMEHAR